MSCRAWFHVERTWADLRAPQPSRHAAASPTPRQFGRSHNPKVAPSTIEDVREPSYGRGHLRSSEQSPRFWPGRCESHTAQVGTRQPQRCRAPHRTPQGLGPQSQLFRKEHGARAGTVEPSTFCRTADCLRFRRPQLRLQTSVFSILRQLDTGASVRSLSDDADAPPDCASEKDLQCRPSRERLKGFEPSTFCMASSC